MTQRRKTFTTVLISSALSLATGAAGGLFTSVKVYGRDVAAMRQRHERHCAIVKIEKTVMHAVAANLDAQIRATGDMVESICAATPDCRRVKVPGAFTMPDLPVEECGEEPQQAR